MSARDMSLKIAQALEYLHDTGICLKNLDAKGILMTEAATSMPVEKSVPRIARLTNAIIMGYEEVTREIYGDIRYRAPEVLRNKPYDFKADSWSFGIILFYLLTSHLPFDEETYKMTQPRG